jgi:hypothetical protein
MRVDFSQVNWLAVAVAAVATFLLGGLWYSALFQKPWIRSQNLTDEQVARMKADMNPAKFFGGMLVSYFVLAVVMALLVTSFDIRTTGSGALLGLLTWVAVAAVHMTGHLASNKAIAAFLIDTSFQLIFLVGMGAVLAAWR